MRRLADQDLPGAGRGLEALRDGDGVAGGECVALGGIAGDDLACVDPGPHPELDPVLGTQLFVQCGESFAELACGANGPQRVVLVQDRDSERGHDRVADEFLDRATVMFEHAADLDEVARDHAPVRLGVELFAERRRVDHVGEDERHRLAHLARRSRLLQRSPTGEAKPRVNWIRLATAETDGHVRQVWN